MPYILISSEFLVLTKGGNSERAPCVFPFTFTNSTNQRETVGECVVIPEYDKKIPVCGTTNDLDKDKLWGKCKKPREFYFGP